MNEFELFKRKYDDLEALCRNIDPYNLLKASAIIRNFFLDELNLVDQVNSGLKEKIKFKAIESDFGLFAISGLKASFEYDSIFPGDFPSRPHKELNRDQFFAMPILCYEGKKYTVRLLIKFGANVLGGVHHDPTSKREVDYPKLMELKNDIEGKTTFLKEKGILLPPINVVLPIASIGHVVLEGLSSLREKV